MFQENSVGRKSVDRQIAILFLNSPTASGAKDIDHLEQASRGRSSDKMDNNISVSSFSIFYAGVEQISQQ